MERRRWKGSSARAHRRYGDHAIGLGRQVDTVIRHLTNLLRAGWEVWADLVDLQGRAQVLVLVAERGDQGHAVLSGVVKSSLSGVDDRRLLLLLGCVVRRVCTTVVQPRIDEEAHVDHVDAVIAGIGQCVDRRPEEEESRVLAGAKVDQGDVGCDTGNTDPVDR